MRINPAVYRYIEHELYNYTATKQEIAELREDIISAPPIRDVVSGTGSVSDPTSRKALQLTSNKVLARMERTVRAIDRALSRLSDEHGQVFVAKYIQCQPWQQTVAEMPLSQATYFRLRKEIVVAVGIELGLINPV